MEIVVLKSDIARLVLDYLKSQKLKKATHTFCKTSPYLKQEFSAYKQGLQTHSFFPELEEIICEYVKISRKVEQLLPKLNNTARTELQESNLSQKVNKLLELATQSIPVSTSKNDQNLSASLHSNNTEENGPKCTKRKRSMKNSSSSSNEEYDTDKRDKMTSQLGHYSKKRRVLQPYCFLSNKSSQLFKSGYDLKHSTTSTDKEENEESCTSNENDHTNDSDCLDNTGCYGERDIFGGEIPTKVSTPHTKLNKKGELATPILPEISQAILDNTEFQQKLVENINQALNHSSSTNISNNVLQQTSESGNRNPPANNKPAAVGEEISSAQLLDQMIKNILDATEKEPSFDAIIQEVMEASSKPQVQTAAVQCNINIPNLSVINNPPLYTATDPPPLVPALPVTQIQQFPTQTSPTSATQAVTRHLLNIPATNAAPPRTPIIIRTASGSTAATSSATSGTVVSGAEDTSSVLGNNSFGQLIDPNFSISKLIVLNSNDSGQKQSAENSVGNTTADNLINQLPDPSDEQVYFDTTTSSQLTFPIFITNDGLLTNLPFLINNDLLNQQLQTNNMGNLEGSRLEIPLSEPLVVNANQFPPNSFIISSVQKENVIEKSVTAEKSLKIVERKHSNTMPPASSNDRLLQDKATPSSNGIVNNKAFRSLSTPRKRTSHVRTLTFSPRNPISWNNAGTPLSSHKETARCLPKAIPEENTNKTTENETNTEQAAGGAQEKVVIKAVEILPAISTATAETVTENTNTSTNDSGNIPPLFVSEESSNQTIINKNVASRKEAKHSTATAAQVDNTPKRKQHRKTAVRSCRRQISKPSNAMQEEDTEKVKEKSPESTAELGQPPVHKDMMEEWLRLRNSSVDLDVRLREINASTQSQQKIKKVNTKKRVRRKKPAAIKKKEKELVRKAEELENSKELQKQQIQNKVNDDVDADAEAGISSHLELSSNKAKQIDSVAAEETSKNVSINQDKSPIEKSSKNPGAEKPAAIGQEIVTSQSIAPSINEVLEREKRNKNMAFLLETPFKDPHFSSSNPPTPGIFAPSLDTPAYKLRDPHDEMQASASFLFGSLTKSEMDTPLMGAITPGFRLAPFGIKDMGTPKSAPGTDYSSGAGSYYRPDESEDLDRNIEKIIRGSAQKNAEEANATDSADRGEEEGEIVENRQENENDRTSENVANNIEIEIPIEKLRVEPIVLKRVRSFGTEATECIETAKINPHYTFVSGLPEISAAEDECSSSSSSSSSGSSSSSKSSSSSSSTSSSSSSSSSSSHPSDKSKTALEAPSKPSINDLDNLSEISSTEDEEWQKLAFTDNDENSQLISNDGEVRYPVRSWLTPVKEGITFASKTIVETEITQMHMPAKPATIKVTLPLKSPEKRIRQVKELELKKERIKEKLKIDSSTTTKRDKLTVSATTPPNISAALAASRMMHAMREKGKKPSNQPSPHSGESGDGKERPQAVKEKRSLDVLTALNLSAKKQVTKTPERPNKTSRLLLTDGGKSQKTSFESLPNKAEPKMNITSITPTKTPQRKCLPIEARPVTRTIRKTGKKIVRTPLAFKVIHSPGKINSHSTTTTLAELAASKTVNKGKEAAGRAVQQTLRVSPRLLKPSTLRAQKPHELPTPKSKAVTRNSKKPSAKLKAAKSLNLKKKAEPAKTSLAMKKIDVLEDRKEVSSSKKINEEELDNETDQLSAAPSKPKINLKARNAMISNKQKKIVEPKKSEKKTLAKEEKAEQQAIVEENAKFAESAEQILNTDSHISNPPIPPTTIVTTTSKEIAHCIDSADDSDPLEDCCMQTIDETDTTSFIKCVYSGPEGPPANEPTPHDFSNFHMVVAIDEFEKHVWHISEGICLFSAAPIAPNPTAILPKKRKIRATTVTAIISENVPATTSLMTSNAAAVKSFTHDTPAATSTPNVNRASNSRMHSESSKAKSLTEESRSQGKASIEQQTVEANSKRLREANNENQKIKIEDIESILSHLHGT